MRPHEASSAGERAARELEFLNPAFAAIEASYAERLTELAAERPWEAERITKLATALKIAREVRKQIESVVAAGKLGEADIRHAAQIEGIRSHKRNILGL